MGKIKYKSNAQRSEQKKKQKALLNPIPDDNLDENGNPKKSKEEILQDIEEKITKEYTNELYEKYNGDAEKAKANVDTLELKKRMFTALFSQLGFNIAQTCKRIGVSRMNYYKWMDEDPNFKERFVAEQEKIIDFAETKLYEHIQKGDTTALIFFLKTKAKKRGYVERQEFKHEGSFQFSRLREMKDEDLDKIIEQDKQKKLEGEIKNDGSGGSEQKNG